MYNKIMIKTKLYTHGYHGRSINLGPNIQTKLKQDGSYGHDEGQHLFNFNFADSEKKILILYILMTDNTSLP